MTDIGFDLFESLSSDDEATMLVTVPLANGDTATWAWTMASPSHPKAVAQKNRIARESLKKSAEQEQAQVNGRKYKAELVTPEQVDRNNVDFIIERTVGWSSKLSNGDDVTVGGEPFPFSEENARKLLMLPKMWRLRNQAVEFILDDNSFMKRSART